MRTQHRIAILFACLFGLAACERSEDKSAPSGAEREGNEVAARAENAAPEPERAEAPATASVDAPAPDFSLVDQAGVTHRLSQYRGRIVVLEWINPDCPYVKRHHQARTMKTLSEAYTSEQVVWLAVDSSHFVTPERSQTFRAEQQLAYPILQDPSGEVGRRYAARTTPHMFVIDAEGVLRYAGAIDDDPRGTSEAPRNHVRETLGALLAGEPLTQRSTEPYGCTVKYES